MRFASRSRSQRGQRDQAIPSASLSCSVSCRSLILIVTMKYVVILLRADNHGEGGTLALMALAHRALGRGAPIINHAWHHQRRAVLRRLHHHAGTFSAVRNRRLEGGHAGIRPLVVPPIALILWALFLVQSRGTAKVLVGGDRFLHRFGSGQDVDGINRPGRDEVQEVGNIFAMMAVPHSDRQVLVHGLSDGELVLRGRIHAHERQRAGLCQRLYGPVQHLFRCVARLPGAL
jgi:hypothetical protein